MNGTLFLLMLLTGIGVVGVAAVMIIKDGKRNKELIRVAEAGKGELQSIIGDAELMVDELNNFSDYIISQIEKKNSEVDSQLTKLDEKLKKVVETQVNLDMSGERLRHVESQGEAQKEGQGEAQKVSQGEAQKEGRGEVQKEGQGKVQKEGQGKDQKESQVQTKKVVYRMVRRNRAAQGDGFENEERQPYDIRVLKGKAVNESGKRTAVLVMNEKKYGSILKYADEGMTEAEIARKLNIGKGEVELIIGLKSYYEKF